MVSHEPGMFGLESHGLDLTQFTATSQRCGLTIQSVPAVTKDIFLWIVGPWHSVNYFNSPV